MVEKEYSIEAILKELAEIQNQGPKNVCVLGTRHCSFLHQQVTGGTAGWDVNISSSTDIVMAFTFLLSPTVDSLTVLRLLQGQRTCVDR